MCLQILRQLPKKSDLHSRTKSIALIFLFKKISLFYTDSIYALSCFVFESTLPSIDTRYRLNSDYVQARMINSAP